MAEDKPFVHPYIPNSVPEVKNEMLKEIGAGSVNELFDQIPESLRFKGKMNLPGPLLSEMDLRRHVESILAKNRTCGEYLSFLGAGCWQHYVPAVCDEINHRSEFLTAYGGEPYEDHGRFQALFEYESMMGELLDLDVMNVPTYDGSQAAATSIRMSARITGRSEALVPRIINPDRLQIIRNYCNPHVEIRLIDYNPVTGELDLDDLKSKVSEKTAAVYFENPSYLGFIETQGQRICDIAHQRGAIPVVGADPLTLGVLAPPPHYGADIVCGDIQSLGIHMNYGGGLGGFIATRDEERFVHEYPSRLFGISTNAAGEWVFGDVAYERTSFAQREKGKEFVGTHAALWGITAGVYLALMGPRGLRELGEVIMQKSLYAKKRIAGIKGVTVPFNSVHFQEFVVNFDGCGNGRTVDQINKSLLEKGIFGGKDLSKDFPELGNSTLYCVTEVHTREDIDRLAQALDEIVAG
ncbi:MAG: aminomethyl-transferring glycine dehydrogenase subunit GcvPA [Ignavibacteriales bacterium]